uniref:Kunitz/Bovine pancreatic trypsin inhibitor domain protein n=1 Tax=Rhabditophanes sp. KR3021 TaxID=114890 RepID=A0AC35TV60_9BILA
MAGFLLFHTLILLNALHFTLLLVVKATLTDGELFENDKAFQDALLKQEQDDTTFSGYSINSGNAFNSYPQQFTNTNSNGNVCSLPQQIGTGPYRIPRWYYNSIRQKCELFYWSGCCSNGNNHASLGQCQQSCEESPNPCANGPSSNTDSLTKCSTSTQCNPSQFCHIGATVQTTVCCNKPTNTDRCNQPLNIGIGNANLQRWYYNRLTGKCQNCVYKGLQGNENNFLTRFDCENSCLINPCARGSPFQNQGSNVQCSVNNQAACPAGYYCHIGAGPQTTVCCQALGGSPCNEILHSGEGNGNMQRWYYNVVEHDCLPFNYKGIKGSSNNYVTRNQCVAKCPVWKNPCSNGEPMMGSDGKPRKCLNSNGSCPINYFCHVGALDETTVCCPSKTNSCQAPMTIGAGDANLQRWYFDANANQCKSFTYKGLYGTENNFMLKEQCSFCIKWNNPCSQGQPILSNMKPMTCDPNNRSCSNTHYCHVGGTTATTVCCPKDGGNECKLPLNIGEGTETLPRWYFDSIEKQCKQFMYRGLKGNINNYQQKSICEQACPVFVDPCPSSSDISSEKQIYKSCSINNNQCGSNFWCHVGGDLDTSVCCPNCGDICNQIMERGRGNSQLGRFYWNVAQQKCVPFNYCGQKGTQNNFLTSEDCEKTCYEIDNPCAGGSPQLNNLQRPLQCSVASNTCGNTFWCHYGASAQTTVCCPNRVPDPDICSLPMTIGSGSDSLQRYYYDPSCRQCRPFTYSGRQGNQNNFLSAQACQNQCQVYDNVCPAGLPTIDPETNRPIPCTFGSNSCGNSTWCHLGTIPDDYQCCPGPPTNPGACQGLAPEQGVLGNNTEPVTRYYYDLTTLSCKTFLYNGRKGNQNNFLTEKDCADTCNVFNNPCNQNIRLPPTTCSSTLNTCGSDEYCHIGASQATSVCCPSEGNPCILPLLVGNGNTPLTRYYYDQTQFSCQAFTYTGSGGNQNNFLTNEACDQQCAPNPCNNGMPFVGADGRAQSCTSSANVNSCPSNHWCHIGADASTTVCCPDAQNNVCGLPMSTGEGNARLERYYFDFGSKTCQSFIYKGLKGNQNNFLSARACQLACQQLENPCIGQPATSVSGQVLFCSATNKDACPVNFWCHLGATPETTVCCPGATNSCSVPLAPGTGDAGLARWYYSVDEQTCVPFKYNGKRGNQNNFESQAACNRLCPQELCLLSIDEGACNTPSTRYAFDRSTQKCIPFQYSGCGGNLNNFDSMQACVNICSTVGFR